MTAIGQRNLDVFTGIFDPVNGRTKPQVNAVFTDLMAKLTDRLVVDKIQKAVARLDQGHPHIQRRKHGGIFHPDHPGTDNRQTAWDRLHIKKFVTVQNSGAIERHPVGPKGLGASTDQKPLSSQAGTFACFGQHFDAVRAGETCQPTKRVNIVAVELMLQHVHFVI